MTDTTLKTVQALVEALMKLRKAADARGYDLMDNSYPQKYWYALRDQADGALDAGRALIEQMQREAVQPDLTCAECAAENLHQPCEACPNRKAQGL